MNISTLNVHYLKQPQSIAKLILEKNIHVCGMQEVNGEKSIKELLKYLPEYDGLFDKTYFTFGNGIIYSTNMFQFVSKDVFHLGNHSGTKRSLFIVNLLHKKTNMTYKFSVTHLDHVSEVNRLSEWNNTKKHKIEDCIVLADMNALTESDYSKETLVEIEQIRAKNKWELPKFSLMKLVSETHFDPGLSVEQLKRNGTCRFNTRIDYVLVPRSIKLSCLNYEVVGTISDHSMVIVSIC